MFKKFIYTDRFGRLFESNEKMNQIEESIQELKATTFLKPYISPNLSQKGIASIPPQYFSGVQLKNLYSVPTILPSSRKVTIAVIVAYTYPGLKTDLATYWTNPINFGPNSTPPAINIYTMSGARQNGGWAQEECLDVQMVCTMNPNANIWVVEAKSDNLSDLLVAISYARTTIKADVLSMSWGMSETSSLTQYNSYFSDSSACYCAASGDSNTVSWPATNANCIAVGGTTLIWNPNSTIQRTEYTWNSAGCGYSSIIPQPTYQSNISSITHTNRVIPDVSLIADPNTSVYTVFNGSWYGVGGTSAATPIFAGILSLSIQQRFNLGKSGLTTVCNPMNSTNIQNFLYKTVYTNPGQYSSLFNDITIGSDNGSVAGKNTLTTYNAGIGFDVTTGLGSPNSTNLCNALAAI